MNIVPFVFENRQIRITDQNGDPWFILRDLLDAMGSSTRPADAKSNIIDNLGDGVVSDYPILDSLGRKQTAIIVSESAATYLLSRSNTEKGRELNRFIHVEILPSIRKTGSYHVHNSSPASILEIQIAEAAARMLRMSETSKIRMLATICEEKGISSRFLPSYSEESLVKSLTTLLRENNSSLTAKAANLVLLDLGILEEVERVSSHGVKKFKSLTDYGLKFGKNETSPQNPRETQPLYYAAKFPELLELINKHVED